MKRVIIFLIITALITITVSCDAKEDNMQSINYSTLNTTIQKSIKEVTSYPSLPSNYKYMDWKDTALRYDKLIYDETVTGEHLPIFFWDNNKYGNVEKSFGLPSYYAGSNHQSPGGQEGINVLGSLLSATLLGIDKSNQNGNNLIEMSQAFYSQSLKTVFNNPGSSGAKDTYWYDLTPSVLFSLLSYKYPDTDHAIEYALNTANTWKNVVLSAGGENCDFNHSGFNFVSGQTVDNGEWIEPDAAAGIGLLMMLAYGYTEDEEYLDAAKWCFDFLEKEPKGTYYEVLLTYAPYVAAYLNANHDTDYNISKLLDSIVEGSSARPGWGTLDISVNGYDFYGLQGSRTDGGGYAFLFGTAHAAGALAPVVKYDPRFANDIGKWILHIANNSRYFYSGSMPDAYESCEEDALATDGVIAYEGLRKEYYGKSPIAMGDPTSYNWGISDLGLYGSSQVGIMASIIDKTNVDGILQIDCSKTDYLDEFGNQTYMYYNPYDTVKHISLPKETDKVKAYSLITGEEIILENGLDIPPLSSEVITVITDDGNTEENFKSVLEENRKPSINISLDSDTFTYFLELNTKIVIPKDQALKELSVEIGGEELDFKATEDGTIKVDISSLADGPSSIKASVRTDKGTTDSSEMEIIIANNVSTAFSSMPKDIKEWTIEAGEVMIIGNNAEIGSNKGFDLASKGFVIDFSREPKLSMDVPQLNGKMTVELISDDGKTYTILENVSDTGIIREQLSNKGFERGLDTDKKYAIRIHGDGKVKLGSIKITY